ncbi:MAG: DUF721 domain-containing protein [Phycisphaerales bacterium]|nr:DUF721 domain-containing protein [Phycisphaerales bacterium]
MSRSLQQLQDLLAARTRPSRNLSIAPVIAATADNASRTHKKLGELIEIWETVVPEPLARHTSLTGLRRGVLQVTVDSSSSLFELDRQLRSGLTDQLRREFRGTLVRVKTRIAGAATAPARVPRARSPGARA